MRNGSFALLVSASLAIVACDSPTEPAVSPESAAKVLLPSVILLSTRSNLDDVVDRLLPSVGDAAGESELRIELAAFQSHLAAGDATRAEASLKRATGSLDALADRTPSANADIDAIRIAFTEARLSLQSLQKIQAEGQAVKPIERF